MVDYADVEIADFAAAAIDNGTLQANAEREWVRARQTRVEAAASPTTHATWWSPAARLDGAPLPRPPEGAAAVRRNVPLLARIDGVLVEERVDLAYRAANGYVLVLSGPDDALDRTLRGGRVALAFYQATGAQPEAIQIALRDGQVVSVHLDEARLAARNELARLVGSSTAPDSAAIATA